VRRRSETSGAPAVGPLPGVSRIPREKKFCAPGPARSRRRSARAPQSPGRLGPGQKQRARDEGARCPGSPFSTYATGAPGDRHDARL
jgi:hypothetical protein